MCVCVCRFFFFSSSPEWKHFYTAFGRHKEKDKQLLPPKVTTRTISTATLMILLTWVKLMLTAHSLLNVQIYYDINYYWVTVLIVIPQIGLILAVCKVKTIPMWIFVYIVFCFVQFYITFILALWSTCRIWSTGCTWISRWVSCLESLYVSLIKDSEWDRIA